MHDAMMQARAVLVRVRGTETVDRELEAIKVRQQFHDIIHMNSSVKCFSQRLNLIENMPQCRSRLRTSRSWPPSLPGTTSCTASPCSAPFSSAAAFR